MCEEYLIPSVGDAGEAPVDAVGVVERVGLLLRRQQMAAGLREDGRVGVDSVVGKLRYVDECHRNFHSLHYLRHHAHHSLVRSASPEFSLCYWPRFVEAFATVHSPPIHTPVSKFTSNFLLEYTRN